MASQWDLLKDVIPTDHARQVQSTYYVERFMSGPDAPELVVDLGCGLGRTATLFRRFRPDVRWIGVDIEGSPESLARTSEEEVRLYDGENLPFESDSVPFIYCHQVLEHVRRPWVTLRDVHRVLTPGGLFVGSTSQFEPYHSYSLWGYTLYGFRTLIEDCGLVVDELRPGLDGVALIMRTYNGRRPEDSRWFAEESPLNQEIDAWAAATGRGPAQVNNRKLEFCGQFAFVVRKPV